MPRFTLDEDMPRSTGKTLRERGYEVMDIRDHGLRGASDEGIYDFAQEERAVILTGDRGFGNILRFPLGRHFGIVVANLPSETPTSDINRLLVERLEELSDNDFKGNPIIIEPDKIRIRRE
jgi:predicted nuclease of predicted toxin-antitoxin system